jgi:hypothetical protein
MLKFIKLGFGFCMDHVCYDIRDGNLNREEAIELVLKYDGKCADKYIKEFCMYIGISQNIFWNTVEKFRGNMWNDSNGLKNKIHDLLQKELIK